MSRSDSAYHHGSLKPALEDAALDLMRTTGHTELSLREVARVAGVSHNAPYHHFGDRTALLKRLSERSMAELLDSLTRAQADLAPTDSPRAHLVAVGAAYIEYAARYPERFRIIYDPAVCVPGSPSAEMAPLIAAVEDILARVTSATIPTASRETVVALTTGVWGAVHGLAELVVAGHITLDETRPALAALLDPSADRGI
ncbi:TetR/AcrR family transcriptional regulator [Agreia sp. PsM10]|uniref:TetR/AcrR family transcriptional regulator n=1 Tax=Agreia sp. PsM10 TaxID=3030533 RepID=UPI00263BC456|nr:TetR/AcrR family transcriptional regulator [Agreia sp. PsM10]MDN4641812.1 TetR/AcrR family transcriptional regulator [Agreia sp. PsM10]